MKARLLATASAVLMAMSTGASAQAYFGANVGVSNLSADCAGTTHCDKTGTAYKLYAGYRFTPNVAVEWNYLDFGKATATGSETINTGESSQVVDVSMKLRTTAIGAGVALFASITPEWWAVGRLGVAQVKTAFTASALGVSISDSDRHVKAYYGLGLSYRFAKNLSVDAALDFSKSEYSKSLGTDAPVDLSGSVRTMTVGLSYLF